jgi:hypothetical protein
VLRFMTLEYRIYHDLVCPECGGVLFEIKGPRGSRQWMCLGAINEWTTGSGTPGHRARLQIWGAKHEAWPHSDVRYWTEADEYIRGQLDSPTYCGRGLVIDREKAA